MESPIYPHHASEVTFTTFGMFIVDEIEWQGRDTPKSKHDLIGGAGTYAILGARLVGGYQLSKSISWIVDVGIDFPPMVKETIDTWNTNCIYRDDPDRKTTRAWNGYGANDFRAFKYLTPKRRLEVSSFNTSQLMANGFHMVCSPDRCSSIVNTLQRERLGIDPQAHRPVIIWEPIPDLCTPDELSNLQKAAQHCMVVSPNGEELRMFFSNSKGISQEKMVAEFMGWTSSLLSVEVRTRAAKQNELTLGPVPIIREGACGSTAYFPISLFHHPRTSVISLHVNAYHTPSSSRQVIDPTGGGNTYLGALGMSLTGALDALPATEWILEAIALQDYSQTEGASESNQSINLESWIRKLLVAMIYATIAASFAIEQNGVPELSNDWDEEGGRGKRAPNLEKWNGETVINRMRAYLSRESAAIKEQLTIAYRNILSSH